MRKRVKRRRKVSIIIPAHNEEKNIKETVIEIADNFRSAQIIVVCNGCTDKTFGVARKIKRPNVHVINFHERIGKGGAILEGFKLADGDVVGFVDADGSFKIKDIEKIIDRTKRYDSVIASKWKGKGFFEVQSSFGRKVGSRGWNFLAKSFGEIDFSDTQAGLKFFNREAVDAILKEDFVCRGFDFDVELISKIQKMGFKTNEVYVPIRDGGRSTFEMRNSAKMFASLLKFYFSKSE